MARYYFHQMIGGFEPDRKGTECIDLQAARLQAVLHAGEVLQQQPELVWCGQNLRFDVVDDIGTTHFTIVILAISKPPEASDQRMSATAGDSLS